MITCPDCNGAKTKRVLARLASGTCEWRDMNCFTCNGTGDVPADMLRWREQGQAIRRARLARDASQRDEARRLGLDVVAYSQMEQGLRDPQPIMDAQTREE